MIHSSVRSAVRQLAARPGMTVIIVLMLAVGVGANTAVFSLFHRVLMQPLPVPEPERLVNLSAPGPKEGTVQCSAIGSCDDVFSYPMFKDLQNEQQVFTDIAGHRDFDANVLEGERANVRSAMLVSGSYFSVLGLQPATGRLIAPIDAPRTGDGNVVVLAHHYWRDRFGADPDIVGTTLVVNRLPLTIIGVTPEDFSGTSLGIRPNLFVPLTIRGQMDSASPVSSDDRRYHWIYAFARLRPGVSAEEATVSVTRRFQAILQEIEAPMQITLGSDELQRFRDRSIVLSPGFSGQSALSGESSRPLKLLFGVTILVLIIACVNIANLLLARSAARTGEFAVRAALGAGRARMARQLMSESAVLGFAGMALSVPVAVGSLRMLSMILPPELAAVASSVGPSAFLFAVAAGLGTLVVFGMAPALQAARIAPGEALKGNGARMASARGSDRFRANLVVVQIALSAVLLVTAGLFSTSLARLGATDTGLDVDSTATFVVTPRNSGIEGETSMRFYEALEQRLEAEPGISSVGASIVPVLAGAAWQRMVAIDGYEPPPGQTLRAAFNEVSPGFFETLGIEVLTGRGITEADRIGARRVTVVNEAFADRYGLGRNPVGKRIYLGPSGEEAVEIVGLVADSRFADVRTAPEPLFYLAQRQNPSIGFLNLYVRSSIPVAQVIGSIPRIVAEVNPDVPPDNVRALNAVITETVFLDRLIGWVSSVFAALATFLAATGLYGVLAYMVTQRTRELGLRQALGATRGTNAKLVLSQVARLGFVGVSLGVGAAYLVGHLAESLLFGISAANPVVYGSAVMLLALVIFSAGALPAHRASLVDPMRALREE